MTSSGSALVLMTLHTLLTGGPDTLSRPAPVPRALALRVGERFAEAWGLPASRVRLSWGRATPGPALDDDTPFRVLGRGAGGWFAVVFEPSTPNATAIQVRAGVLETTRVASRALARGLRLAEGDIREERAVHWGPPAAAAPRRFGEPVAAGWITRRAVQSGEPLAWPAVAPPPMVVAGEPVRLEWLREGVRVTFTGIALHDAREGETVHARIAERPARLAARVTAPGVAELPASSTGAGALR